MDTLDLRLVAGKADWWRMDEWGKTYEGDCCPSQPGVQEKWIEAVREASRAGQWLELRGLGFRGTCFCAACHYGYGAAGGILEQLAREHPEGITGLQHPSVNVMLLWRRSVQYGLLDQMKAVRAGKLCLRTAAELRFTGDKSSLTFVEAKAVVNACSVECRDAGELERLRNLERPLPVYCVREKSFAGIEDRIFAGYL